MKKARPKTKVSAAYPQRARNSVVVTRKEFEELKRAQAAYDNLKVGMPRTVADTVSRPKGVNVSRMSLARMSNKQLANDGFARLGPEDDPRSAIVVARPFRAPNLFPNVVPKGRKPGPLPGETPHFALDSSMVAPTYAWANNYCAQIGFPGYPYLAQLALRSEYRAPAETTAKEMTRRWVQFKSASQGDKGDKINALKELWRVMMVRDKVRAGVYNDMIFGRYQLFLDIKGDQSDIARQRPLNLEAGLGKDCLLNIQGIEPMWTTPYSYNSIDPTREDFYKPVSWFVLGRKTHASRLLDIVSRPVPDLFKPAYNFGGLSMSQLMEPYVMQFYRARDSVSDVMYAFSTSGIATNLSAYLEEDDGGEERRAEMFNKLRGNRGLLIIDKDTEEFFQFNVPLGSLDKLMAQFQEHMAAPSHTPLVKLLGITPSGLNASSEGEIKVYYDWIHSEQEAVLDTIMAVLMVVSQWHLFGSYDPDITYEWVHMDEPTQAELAQIRKSDADAGAQYIANGVITNQEERERLQHDPQSGYNNLKGNAPEMTPDQQHELDMQGNEQEHASGENEADREHATGERKDGQKFEERLGKEGRKHDATQADKDRKVAAKKAAKPK